VEKLVLQRVGMKARTFGQELKLDATGARARSSSGSGGTSGPEDLSDFDDPGRVDPNLIMKLYRDHIIPLTKIAEVRYLFQRLSTATVAHHGGQGSACERATFSHFVDGRSNSKGVVLRPYPTAAEVFSAVLSRTAHFGVALLELGDSGVLHTTRSLLEQSQVCVVGELVHRGTFHLVSRVNDISQIRKVRGRPESLRLCSAWYREALSTAIEEEDVVAAGPYAASPWDDSLADPAHEQTAYLVLVSAPLPPELSVLLRAPDALVEYARFIILCKSRETGSVPSGHDKTLMLFRLKQGEVGSLARALTIFNSHAVNMRLIQSFTDVNDESASFFTELDGHEHDPSLSAALTELQQHAAGVLVFGSFAVPTSRMARPAA